MILYRALELGSHRECDGLISVFGWIWIPHVHILCECCVRQGNPSKVIAPHSRAGMSPCCELCVCLT